MKNMFDLIEQKVEGVLQRRLYEMNFRGDWSVRNKVLDTAQHLVAIVWIRLNFFLLPVVTTTTVVCPVPHLIDNGECDPEAHNEACYMDGKDCGNYFYAQSFWKFSTVEIWSDLVGFGEQSCALLLRNDITRLYKSYEKQPFSYNF